MKVLYIHHCGVFGGASKSLLESLNILVSTYHVRPIVITPKGSTYEMLSANVDDIYTSIGISQFDHTIVGYYRKFRWLVLLREIFYLLPTIKVLLEVKKKERNIELIHVNDTSSLLPMLLAKYIFKLPCIMHARTVIAKQGKIRRYILKQALKYIADGVVAIDENVKSSLPYKNNCVVIHNGLNMDGLPQDHRESVVKSDKDICVAFFGNYLKQKGIYEFVQSAHECKKQNLPIKFCIVGPRHTKTGFLGKVLNFLKIKEDMVSLIDKYVTDNELDNINFIPFQKDIRAFMPNIDILCFPSRMEGIGRPVFEAAFFKKPSIVVITQPMSDTFIDGVTGIAIADGSVQNLCNAYKFFCNNPNFISYMGEAAYELANKNFDINKNTEKLYKFYLDCLNENTASNIR